MRKAALLRDNLRLQPQQPGMWRHFLKADDVGRQPFESCDKGRRSRLKGLADIPEVQTEDTRARRPPVQSDAVARRSATARPRAPSAQWRRIAWRVQITTSTEHALTAMPPMTSTK